MGGRVEVARIIPLLAGESLSSKHQPALEGYSAADSFMYGSGMGNDLLTMV